ncbi:MAG: aldehyde dehydrogenase, partial [Ignavibacteria bacterium]|nr:aldehyde dehydrogenase [Ignavibacteria bacterium]
MVEEFKNLINGEWKSSSSGKTTENRNPADWESDLIGLFPASNADDINEAVEAA